MKHGAAIRRNMIQVAARTGANGTSPFVHVVKFAYDIRNDVGLITSLNKGYFLQLTFAHHLRTVNTPCLKKRSTFDLL